MVFARVRTHRTLLSPGRLGRSSLAPPNARGCGRLRPRLLGPLHNGQDPSLSSASSSHTARSTSTLTSSARLGSPKATAAATAAPTPRSDVHATPDLLSMMLRNPELSPDEAETELRWIRDEVRQRSDGLSKRGKLPPIEDELVESFVSRRGDGEPLQYILGATDFGPLTLRCVRPVLIPRPETAHCTALLSEHILSAVPPLTARDRPSAPLDILDLCTGSGCIALLLAHLNPLSRVRGIDNSPAAVGLATANAQSTGLGDRVKIAYGNVFTDPLRLLERGTKVGLVVSNPPYIPWEEYQALPKSVREYESPSALLGDGTPRPGHQGAAYAASLGNDGGVGTSTGSDRAGETSGRGLAFYERIIDILPSLLVEQDHLTASRWGNIPRVAMEVGHDQAPEVVRLLGRPGTGIARTEIWKDQWGVGRFVLGWAV